MTIVEAILNGSRPRPSYAARRCADELEAYLQKQQGEPDWTPVVKEYVARIINRHFPVQP